MLFSDKKNLLELYNAAVSYTHLTAANNIGATKTVATVAAAGAYASDTGVTFNITKGTACLLYTSNPFFQSYEYQCG